MKLADDNVLRYQNTWPQPGGITEDSYFVFDISLGRFDLSLSSVLNAKQYAKKLG